MHNPLAMAGKDKKTTKDANNRGFSGLWWHAAWLAVGMALTQPNTVIAGFVADLTGSTLWVGGLSTVLLIASALPQVFIARLIEPRPFKKKYLLAAIYLRTLSWAILAILILTIGPGHPILMSWALVVLLGIFAAGGGLGATPYTDLVGKVIPLPKRGRFFGGRAILSGPLALLAAMFAKYELSRVTYPVNYALLFGLAAAALGIASLGFLWVKEPPAKISVDKPMPWHDYRVKLLAVSGRLKTLVIVQLFTGFLLMIMPFYVVYARKELGAPVSAIGWFTLAQVGGSFLGNLLWAYIVDHHGGKRMLTVASLLAAITPVLAVILTGFGWQMLLPVFFFTGAAFSGRNIGISSTLLEIAPAAERPSFKAMNTILTLPVAFLSFLAGILLYQISYSLLFILASIFISAGVLFSLKLPERKVV